MADRLTALDTSFLHLEDDAAHMHVASVMLFDGDPPPHDEFIAGDREPAAPRAALPPEARLRPVRAGQAALGRRPAPEPELPRAQDRAARAGHARSSCARSRAACSPSSSTATSRSGRSGWSRASRATASRSICKTHHALVDGISGVDIVTVLFDLAPEAEQAARSPSAAGCPRRCRRARSCSPRRCSSAPPCPTEIARSVRAVFRAPRQIAGGRARLARRRRRDGLGGHEPGSAEPLQLPHRAAPPLHLGAHRTSTTSRRSRTGSAAR